MERFGHLFGASILTAAGLLPAATQEHDAVNEANNPLTPKIIVNFHDYYGNYSILVGLGLGKVIPINGKVTMNGFKEPQYTMFGHGPAQPEWQIFAG